MNDSTTYSTKEKEATQVTKIVPVPISNSVTTTTETNTWTTKEKIVYGLLSVVGIGGTIWWGNRFIHKQIADKAENKSFEDGSPQTIAKQIKMAFDNDGWWGTNITALREALTSVSSQADWNNVVKSYSQLYNSNLLKDMSDELQSSEYNEMVQIINAKPKKKGDPPLANQYSAWAKRLKAAFDKSYGIFGGTDSEAIVTALNEMPTQKVFVLTGIAYKKLYVKSLIDDLKSEAEFGQFSEWMGIILKKPKA